jgi:hypothetical protein
MNMSAQHGNEQADKTLHRTLDYVAKIGVEFTHFPVAVDVLWLSGTSKFGRWAEQVCTLQRWTQAVV